jgi:lipopolysaccharide/colanic/teichoic acid biosynthesis glycosyltransferase
MYRRFLKRFLDVVISAGGLLLVSPLLLFLMSFIYIKTRKNPLFYQKRPGLHGKIFTLVKLRTMREELDSTGNSLPDKDRITHWGKKFRETSLDEIPQLINVLKGDMSLIGPRPLLPEYLPRYSAYQQQRHNVRPGITGWAQIHGRNAISWQQKFDLDVWYVHNYGFKTDVKIFFQTLREIIKKEGVNYSDSTTMPEFEGTDCSEESKNKLGK